MQEISYISPEMTDCIEKCLDCYATCRAVERYCMEQGGKHAELNRLLLIADCAEICRTSADFLLRGSAHHGVVCEACAVTCRACEESCRELAQNDEVMLGCVEACKSCAGSCEAMTEA